jgi:hypothetical protein
MFESWLEASRDTLAPDRPLEETAVLP